MKAKKPKKRNPSDLTGRNNNARKRDIYILRDVVHELIEDCYSRFLMSEDEAWDLAKKLRKIR